MGAPYVHVKELAPAYETKVKSWTKIDAVLEIAREGLCYGQADNGWEDVKFLASVPNGSLYYYRPTETYYIVEDV